MDPQSLYVQLGHLIAEMPDLRISGPLSTPTIQWLGKAHALLGKTRNDIIHTVELKSHTNALQLQGPARSGAAVSIALILYRALAEAELDAPAATQGAFIPARSAFDAMAAVGKVFQTAKQEVFVVDPYLDETALTDFIPLVREHLPIRLLADQQAQKPTLKPAVTRWKTQYNEARPIDVRLAVPRALHDRVIIIDGIGAWSLTQSLNAFAARSPASIVRVDSETAVLKIAAYEAIWNSAVPI